MGKRDKPRSPVRLDSGGTNVTPQELTIILHAADSVVHRGGRSQLVKLLKGSRDKRLLGLGMDADGSYGALSCLTLNEIACKVDWTIEQGYLDYYYERRQPLLMFTQRGWELERPVAAYGHYEQFCSDVADGKARMAERMANIKTEVQLDVIELIAERCDQSCLPYLEAWSDAATKRIRKKIAWAIRTVNQRGDF